jgi:hypothetical protein
VRRVISMVGRRVFPPCRKNPKALEAINRTVGAAPEQEIGIDGGKPGPGRGHKTGSDTTRLGRGATYILRRLKRDRPDLAERVIVGEKSANAAAIEAGFRLQTRRVVTTVARRIQIRFGARLCHPYLVSAAPALPSPCPPSGPRALAFGGRGFSRPAGVPWVEGVAVHPMGEWVRRPGSASNRVVSLPSRCQT